MISDIIIEKINIIRRCLGRINEVTKGDPASLDHIDQQDIYVLNLQRAIQACIDVAQAIVKEENLELPDIYRDSFKILVAKKILSNEIGSKMQNMCGFRNIAIHAYKKIKVEVLKSILLNDLYDLEKFYQEVISFYKIDDELNG